MRTSLLVLALLSLSVVAADWARFRGPNGTGISNDKEVPVQWSDKEILFKTRLTGVGHSSPIVIGSRVFLLSATDTQRMLACFDASNGKELWTVRTPGSKAKKHAKSSFASSTPASDGERVFCVFWDGEAVSLHAYDLQGKPLWKHDLGSFTSQHGPGFSPIVEDGIVIVNNDQDGLATLLAFDAKSGEKLWSVDRRAVRACYSTPIVVELNNEKLVMVTSTPGITGYNLRTGKEAWNFTWSFERMMLRTVGSSIVADGLIFGCSGDGSGERNMIAVKLSGSGDVTRTNLVWSRAINRATPYVPTLVAQDKYLYGVLDEGQAICLEAATGKELWRSRLAANVSASPILIDGKVYVCDERGEVFVFQAEPTSLKLLGRSSVGELIMASPAVAHNRLYLRGERHLIAIGKK